ncbi:hypothetical protein FRC03_003463 [Tulasnella sp. 419]|nr:hypothetical protein FRC03_003463 [Tulasnella sp. 419]
MIQRLRLVCPHWNHIIENTPALWIHIIIGDGRKRSLPPFRAWTSQSVSLLKNATLHIEIEYLHVKAKSYGEIMNAMENILLPVLNRWGTCRLSYATSCIEHHVELFNRAAPRLKSFVVEPDPDTPEDEVLPITRLFDNHAPQLHTLSIPTLALSWDSPILTNLTHLRILAWDGERMPTEDQYYKILNSNPGLTLLWIEGRIEDLDQPGIDFRFDAVMP